MPRTRKGRTRRGRAAASLNRRPRCERLEDRRVLAAITVDTTADVVDLNDGFTSLREAIFAANTVPGHQEILFDFGTDGPETIVLTEGELRISDALTITGDGPDLLTIDASGNDPTPDSTLDDGDDTNDGDGSRVFFIDSVDATLSGMTLTGGDVEQAGGAVYAIAESGVLAQIEIRDSVLIGNVANEGGAFVLQPPSIITSTIVRDNQAILVGGGVAYSASLTDSTVSNNEAVDRRGHSGGLLVVEADIRDSSIEGNRAATFGGGITSFLSLTVANSSIRDNHLAHDFGPDNPFLFGPFGTPSQLLPSLVGGGGIYGFGGDITLIDSNVTGNTTAGEASEGGGIRLRGYDSSSMGLTLVRSSVSGNRTNGRSAEGGGVSTSGTVTLVDSTVAGNRTQGPLSEGGGIRAYRAVVTGSTISGNSTNSDSYAGGGGISANFITLTNSTVSNNRTYGELSGGGAIQAWNSLTINGSTISGNQTKGRQSSGGGIEAWSSTITSSTIVGNSAVGEESTGGGLMLRSSDHSVLHSIVQGNEVGSGAEDVATRPSTVRQFSLEIADSLVGAIAPGTEATINNTLLGFDPLLGPLEDNGGPTPTHALLPGSPAIDAGDPSLMAGVGGVPEFDQRGPGFTRVAGAAIDIGAFEVQTRPPGLSALVDDLDGDGDNDLADLLGAQRGTPAQALAGEQPVAQAVMAVEEDAGPIVVTTTADVIDFGDGVTSLREAIFAANTVPGHQEIVFDFGFDGPATILLAEGELQITDSLTITGPGSELLTIDASGNDPTPDSTLDDGDDTNDGDGSRVFFIIGDRGSRDPFNAVIAGVTLTGGDSVAGGAVLNLENLTVRESVITHNHSNTSGGGINSSFLGSLTLMDSSVTHNTSEFGGGLTTADLLIERSDISDNRAFLGGGVDIYQGIATIRDSTIQNNHSLFGDNPFTSGGGVSLISFGRRPASLLLSRSHITNNSAHSGGGLSVIGGILVVEESSISSNRAELSGGGLSVSNAQVTMTDSAVFSNEAQQSGGGLLLFSGSDRLKTDISNTTFSSNYAGVSGGGMQFRSVGGPVLVRHSTFTENRAGAPDGESSGSGAGILAESGAMDLDHVIAFGNEIAGNTPEDIASEDGTFTVASSLLGTIAPETQAVLNNTLLGFDPLLGPLQDNGGPTPTHALLPGSPAIDAGDPSLIAGVDGVPEFDQRGAGFTRVAGAAIDIGAFEVQTRPPGMSAIVDDRDGDGDTDVADLLAAQRGAPALALAGEQPVARALAADFDLPEEAERRERDAVFAAAVMGPVRPEPAAADPWSGVRSGDAIGPVDLIAEREDDREPDEEAVGGVDDAFADWV